MEMENALWRPITGEAERRSSKYFTVDKKKFLNCMYAVEMMTMTVNSREAHANMA